MATAATPQVGIIGAGVSGPCMATWRIEQMRAGRVACAAPTEVATKSYNEDIKAALPEVFPLDSGQHQELLQGPVVADFEVRSP
ncbi:hypothetical protein [Mycolicibacterium sphagni]|nr:hypothetical protein [Mycolicibacterium sphagni]MCV7174484.1 hypothetical protein [Mycolicibacterium sphagni]